MNGKRRDEGLRDQVVERPHVDAVEVDHAESGLLDRVLLLAELGRMEHLRLKRPPVFFSSSAPEVLDRLDGRIAVRVDVGGAQGGLRLGAAARHGGQQSASGNVDG